MSFADYMNNRANALKNITASLEAAAPVQEKNNTRDDRIWKPKMGADGTGYAVVRFLPGKDMSKTPWVKMFSHGFQGPNGKWYIENSLTTLGQKDPVSEFNSALWNNGTESGKEQARKQKRRTAFYANVLVLKDPTDPSNEGKIKLYQFGQKIFDKMMAAMQPEFADETPVNPFDMFEGANFRIKIKTIGGYWNYDSSDFERPAPISEDDARLEQVFNAQHDVHELISADKFKSYAELQTRLDEVMGNAAAVDSSIPAAFKNAAVAAAAPSAPTVEDRALSSMFAAPAPSAPVASASNDDDDLEAFFKNLAD